MKIPNAIDSQNPYLSIGNLTIVNDIITKIL